MANAYTLGDTIRVSAAFANSAGNAVDPGTVAVKWRKPDGTIVTGSATKDATGAYHADIDLDAVGEWTYRWTGTVTNKAAAEARFSVKPTLFD